MNRHSPELAPDESEVREHHALRVDGDARPPATLNKGSTTGQPGRSGEREAPDVAIGRITPTPSQGDALVIYYE